MTIVRLRETHGGRDEIVAEWSGKQIVVTRERVEVDGKIVATYEDRHFYPIGNDDHGGNEIEVVQPPRRREPSRGFRPMVDGIDYDSSEQ